MTAREDQHTIARWQAETFGPAASDFSIAARALEEVAELARTVAAPGEPNEEKEEAILTELADAWIVLCRLAELRRVNVNSFRSTVSQMLGRGATPEIAVAAIAARLGRLMQLLAYPVARERQIESSILRVFRSIHEAGRVVDRGFKIWDHVDLKMEVNRARKWQLRGDGHGQHAEAFRHSQHVDEDAGL